jgi:hypothetical protein
MYNEGKSQYSYEELSQYFHLPVLIAAARLRINYAALRANCRAVGIKRWPRVTEKKHRQTLFNEAVQSCKKSISNMADMQTVFFMRKETWTPIRKNSIETEVQRIDNWIKEETDKVHVHAPVEPFRLRLNVSQVVDLVNNCTL